VSQPPDFLNILPHSIALSELLAYELNNIAVPLLGFVDLADSDRTDHRAVMSCLGELKIGIARITCLSQQLESFAAPAATAATVAIGECMIDFSGELHFDCGQETTVSTAPALVRQAIAALSRLCSTPRLEVSRLAGGESYCSACGELLKAGKGYVGIQLRARRLPTPEILQEPFAVSRKTRASRRLAIAALVIVAHRANGHLLATESADSVTFLLPAV